MSLGVPQGSILFLIYVNDFCNLPLNSDNNSIMVTLLMTSLVTSSYESCASINSVCGTCSCYKIGPYPSVKCLGLKMDEYLKLESLHHWPPRYGWKNKLCFLIIFQIFTNPTLKIFTFLLVLIYFDLRIIIWKGTFDFFMRTLANIPSELS